jgi:sulfite reductase (NADPH) flavoprotein alpha-component
MAGLGTGAAPFRAFLQHRAWIAQQGVPVGPMFYYFGSRHQSQEYLYGEEIEAYILDRTITRAGLAFSRDQKKKVYIQHKMLEDAEVLAEMLRGDNGVFYLCGPTWPVPDIYEALVGALVKYKGESAESAGEYLELLKEEERYVLEVGTVQCLIIDWRLMLHTGLLINTHQSYIACHHHMISIL